MKTLAVAAVAIALIGAAPREAAAQEAGSVAGALAATIVGAAVGGAVGYYYFTGGAATVIGLVGGGVIGDYWYTTATSRNGVMPGGKKMHYSDSDAPRPLFHLIGHSDGSPA